jgi:23S rRNA (cytidine2498-2'-O)-methyltransferase
MIPHLVQEPLPRTSRIGREQFVFLVCQHGLEACIKSRWTHPGSSFRLAFSRPGLLTLKIGELPEGELAASESAESGVALPHDWMIRLSGFALGQIRSSSQSGSEAPATAEEMVEQALSLAGAPTAWAAVHVFARDPDLPGLHGFEPGPTPLCDEIGKLFGQNLRAKGLTPRINTEPEVGEQVLDIVLIEPDHWLVGHHLVQRRHERWPGGAYAAPAPAHMVSRAYLKMAEALAWSGLPIQADDWIVEIGSAPGGACQRLLDLGLKVTGVDPAEMDPLLLANPRFEHWRSKSSGVRRKLYSKFRWLVADANVAPNYTLDAVEDIVGYRTSNFEGLILTLKLSTYDLADNLQDNIARVHSWGFRRVEVRQLASNRRECCLVAQR